MSDAAPAPGECGALSTSWPEGARKPFLHLAVAVEWERARVDGAYRRSTIDTSLEEEGFIHCSFPEQVQATADLYYRGRDDIVLLRIDPDRLGVEVVVEEARSGERFPHVYGPIPVGAVTSADPVPMGPDGRLDLGCLSG
jgi:glutathione S-transferase